jgi:hypothetical protein
MLVALKRDELAYVREGLKTVILIRSQQRDHCVSLRLKVRLRFFSRRGVARLPSPSAARVAFR